MKKLVIGLYALEQPPRHFIEVETLKYPVTINWCLQEDLNNFEDLDNTVISVIEVLIVETHDFNDSVGYQETDNKYEHKAEHQEYSLLMLMKYLHNLLGTHLVNLHLDLDLLQFK